MTTNTIALMNLTFFMLSVNKRQISCAFKWVTAESNDYMLGNNPIMTFISTNKNLSKVHFLTKKKEFDVLF